MSNYIIEVSGNQPYNIEIENSTLQNIINLNVEQTNDINLEIVNTENILVTDLPSGYLMSNVVGNLSYTRVDGLTSHIEYVISNSEITVNIIDGGTP
jgi:hypothetical protein